LLSETIVYLFFLKKVADTLPTFYEIPDIPMVAKNQMKGFSTEKSIFETIFILNTIKISIYNIKALKHPEITQKN
jgi:hypothetical protein